MEAIDRYSISIARSFPGQILQGNDIINLSPRDLANSPSTKAKIKVEWIQQVVIKPSVLDISFWDQLHWIFEDVRVVKHSPK
jgi:hypothetical protein